MNACNHVCAVLVCVVGCARACAVFCITVSIICVGVCKRVGMLDGFTVVAVFLFVMLHHSYVCGCECVVVDACV